ncbi:MAG: hypothetical protein V1816_19350 [Pseudomonadota bacterium]
MFKQFYGLVCLLLWVWAGCAWSGPPGPDLLKTGRPQSLNQGVTLLPLLDSRVFPQPESKPVLTHGAPIVIDPGLAREECLKAWKEHGFTSQVGFYQGPWPEESAFKWSEFPQRGLATDLAVGLELKNLDIKLTGFNALMVPQALSNSLALPLFAAGSVISNGAFDLGGRIIPSLQVKYTGLVEINFLSKLAGGLFFSKSYLADLTDWSVSESQLYAGFFRSPGDGRDLGTKNAPRVLGDVFVTAARDPELGSLPQLIQAAWLNRALSSAVIDAETKIDLVDRMSDMVEAPAWTERELTELAATDKNLMEKIGPVLGWDRKWFSGARLDKDLADFYDADPAWIQESLGRYKVFEALARAFLDQAGRLREIRMNRPLDPREKILDVDIAAALSGWGRRRTANLLYRDLFLEVQGGSGLERVLTRLLAQAPEEFGNKELLERRASRLLAQALIDDSPDDPRRAAAFLVAWEGPRVLDRPLERQVVLEVLSGEDLWAAPLVLADLRKSEGPNRECLRLAGAMELEEALPLLTDLATKEDSEGIVLELSRLVPDIPVTLTAALGRETGLAPDKTAAVDALGCFSGRPRVIKALRGLVEKWRTEERPDAALTARAIKSLGLLEDRASLPLIFDIWADGLPAEKDAFLVRRASLAAFQRLAGPEFLSAVLDSVSPMAEDVVGNQAPLGEVVDFFGEARYGPAVEFLRGLVYRRETDPIMVQAAIASLGLIATGEAEEVLNQLAASPNLDLSHPARKALETMVRERSLLAGLDLYTREEAAPEN